MSYRDEDIDFEIDDDLLIKSEETELTEEDEEWDLLEVRWEREDELLNEVSDILDENIEISFDDLRKRIFKLIHDKYPYIYSQDIKMSDFYINILKRLESPDCTTDELKEYLDSQDKYIKSAVAFNTNCTSEMLDEIYSLDLDCEAHFSIASNPNCSDKTINSINADESTLGRIGIALNSNVNEHAFNRLQYVNDTYRRLLLKNPKCSLEVLEETAKDPDYLPYILMNNNCPDYIKCYAIENCLNSLDIDVIELINEKVINGCFSQTIIDFLADREIRCTLSPECCEYLDMHKSSNVMDYNELFKDMFVAKDYPTNTIDFGSLSGQYEYSENYIEGYGMIGNVRYAFDFYGDDGIKVYNQIRELGTNEVAFGEAPLSPISGIEYWALRNLIEKGYAVKTGKTYRNAIENYSHDIYVFDEYDYNGYKFGLSGNCMRKIEPVYWKLDFDCFNCKDMLFYKLARKEEREDIPKYLSEDLEYVAPGHRVEDGVQLKLKL